MTLSRCLCPGRQNCSFMTCGGCWLAHPSARVLGSCCLISPPSHPPSAITRQHAGAAAAPRSLDRAGPERFSEPASAPPARLLRAAHLQVGGRVAQRLARDRVGALRGARGARARVVAEAVVRVAVAVVQLPRAARGRRAVGLAHLRGAARGVAPGAPAGLARRRRKTDDGRARRGSAAGRRAEPTCVAALHWLLKASCSTQLACARGRCLEAAERAMRAAPPVAGHTEASSRKHVKECTRAEPSCWYRIPEYHKLLRRITPRPQSPAAEEPARGAARAGPHLIGAAGQVRAGVVGGPQAEQAVLAQLRARRDRQAAVVRVGGRAAVRGVQRLRKPAPAGRALSGASVRQRARVRRRVGSELRAAERLRERPRAPGPRRVTSRSQARQRLLRPGHTLSGAVCAQAPGPDMARAVGLLRKRLAVSCAMAVHAR
jgi:hypothetical protein